MKRFAPIAIAAGLAVLLFALASTPASSPVHAAAKDDAGPAPEAVERDMHEFMEYVFQPGYKRLKQAMAEEPKDRRGWKPIKAEGLSLAEASNLLFLRLPEKNAASWKKLSAAVREDGKALYAAARKRDFAAATKSYKAMLVQCNECHNQFADGEHQLSP